LVKRGSKLNNPDMVMGCGSRHQPARHLYLTFAFEKENKLFCYHIIWYSVKFHQDLSQIWQAYC